MYNMNGQPTLIPALQFGHQSIQSQAPSYDWEAMQRASDEYQNSCSLIHERANAEIEKYEARLRLEQETAIYMLKVREDIQIQREMLEETVIITEGGELIRKQEFFHEKPKSYSWANFRLVGHPIKYVCDDSEGVVLFLNVVGQDQEERSVFLDLDREGSGYFWKKFRKEGLCFKKRRGESREAVFEILQAMTKIAKAVEIPLQRGFYTTEDGSLRYAGEDSMIWAEVKKYAE